MITRISLFCLIVTCTLSIAFLDSVSAKNSVKKSRQDIAAERILGSHQKLVKAHNGIEKNKTLNQRVLKLVKRLRKTSNFRHKTVIPVVLKAPQINALSLSSDAQNAYIYVTNGMLNFIRNDDELAFILAHEMAHITLKTPLKKTNKQRVKLELKADLLGAKYMTLAGFDKKFAIAFIKRLNDIQKNQTSDNAHIYPSNQQRLAQLNKLK